MVDEEECSSDVLKWFDICFVEQSQIPTGGKEDDVEDVNNDDIGEEMNKQVLLKDLNLVKSKLNYH